MKYRLYHYWRSSASWRVRWACAIKGVTLDLVHVSLLDGESESPAHLKRHPMGRVPVLELIDSPTPNTLVESVAMLEYFEEAFPTPALLPQDLWLRAQTRSLVDLINSSIHPFQNPSLLQQIEPKPTADAAKAIGKNAIRGGLEAFDALCAPLRGSFCLGDQVTLADLCLVPQLYNARRFEVDLSPFPALLEIESRLLQTRAAQESHPDRFAPKT
jgi:maleylpyruvate isomerase